MEALSIVNITRVGNVDVAESFFLTISYRADQFQIERTRVEIESLLQSFVGNASLPIDNEAYIAEQLNIMFERAGANFWAYPALVQFIDRSFEQSPLTRLHFHRLTSNMTATVNFVESFESRIAGIEFKMDEIFHILAAQQQQQNRLQGGSNYERKASGATTSSGGSLVNILGGDNLDRSGGGGGSVKGSISGSNQGSINKMTVETSGIAFTSGNKASSPPQAAKRSDELASNDSSSDDGNDNENEEAVEKYQSSMNLFLLSKGADGVKLSPESLVTNLQLVEEIALQARYQEEVDTVLKLVQANEQSLVLRASIFSLVRGQARVAINSSVFEYGLHEIGVNLPHDPVLLSVLLSKSNFPNWNASLGERLMLVAEGIEEMWVDGMQPDNNNTNNTPSKGMDPHIENVENHSDEHGFLVSLVVDTVKVEVSSNRRTDLCLLAFFDEVAALVGKNNLFKRSLILIRAWWSYEASTYMHKELSTYLPPTVIAIMVCELFNKYHSRLASPLQALCLFFSEFCSYQESMHIVTLQGLLRFDASSRDALKLIPPQPDHLISWEVMEKYWQLFNANGSSAAVSSSPNPMVNPAFAVEAAAAGGQPAGGGGGGGRGAQFNPYTTGTFVGFPLAGFRVLHPFTYKPMTSDRITPRRMNIIVEAFRIGAGRLCSFLLQDPNESKQLRLAETVFASVQARFGLPDGRLPPANLKPPVYESQYVSTAVERVWQNILYCNFVMEAVISESAILTATIENLSIRGPLPVGEVGKMLTEICGFPQLSLHLKEKFGGLKKFLERFPELFVFSNDHPFNPHLLLRSKFTIEHQSLVFRGVVPTQVMTLYKKGGLSTRKQQQQQQQQPVLASSNNSAGNKSAGSRERERDRDRDSDRDRDYSGLTRHQHQSQSLPSSSAPMPPLPLSLTPGGGGYSNYYQQTGQQNPQGLGQGLSSVPAVMLLPHNYSRSTMTSAASVGGSASPGPSSIPYGQSQGQPAGQGQQRSSAIGSGNYSPVDRDYFSPSVSARLNYANSGGDRRETAQQQQQMQQQLMMRQQQQQQHQQASYGGGAGNMYGTSGSGPIYDRASGYIPAGIATTASSDSLLYGSGHESGGSGRYGGGGGYSQQQQQQRLYSSNSSGGNMNNRQQQQQQQFPSAVPIGSGGGFCSQQQSQQQHQSMFSSSAGTIGGGVIGGPVSSVPSGLAGLRGSSFSSIGGGGGESDSAFIFAMGGGGGGLTPPGSGPGRAAGQPSPGGGGSNNESSAYPPARSSFDFANNATDYTTGSGSGSSK